MSREALTTKYLPVQPAPWWSSRQVFILLSSYLDLLTILTIPTIVELIRVQQWKVHRFISDGWKLKIIPYVLRERRKDTRLMCAYSRTCLTTRTILTYSIWIARTTATPWVTWDNLFTSPNLNRTIRQPIVILPTRVRLIGRWFHPPLSKTRPCRLIINHRTWCMTFIIRQWTLFLPNDNINRRCPRIILTLNLISLHHQEHRIPTNRCEIQRIPS